LAGIGKIADTMEDRSIAIRMRRKAPGEHVKRFRAQKAVAELEILRRSMMRFATDNAEIIKNSDPAVPEQLHDRAQDNWRPLLAIAEVAGGEWPELARAAALQITGVSHSDESVKVVLLKDIQSIFEKRETERITSEDLCSNLHEMEERPWPDWRNGNPITPPQVAKLLKPFGIQPKQLWVAGSNVRGYRFEDFRDSLSRYGGSDPLVR
jgi:putative DNA primase/helicase